jgi:hypothetical protein
LRPLGQLCLSSLPTPTRRFRVSGLSSSLFILCNKPLQDWQNTLELLALLSRFRVSIYLVKSSLPFLWSILSSACARYELGHEITGYPPDWKMQRKESDQVSQQVASKENFLKGCCDLAVSYMSCLWLCW